MDIEVFPAGYGDALLVSYGEGNNTARILIDAGFASTAKTILRRLDELKAHIDLFVITHIDRDHIAGALKLLSTPAFLNRVSEVWYNGRIHLEQFNDLLGPLDGERVGDILSRGEVAWNAAWPWRIPPENASTKFGGPVYAAAEPTSMQLPGGANAIVLSPTADKLTALLPKWKETIRKAGLVKDVKARPEPAEQPRRVLLGGPTLTELADRRTDEDTALANGTSIAFVLEIPDGDVVRRILLTGDAHPDPLTAGLRQIAAQDRAYPVDVCKLPHHGSRYNVTTELAEILDCHRWIISTNGKRFFHPNDEALARVIVAHPGCTVYANYADNQVLNSFATRYPPIDHDYHLVHPTSPGRPGLQVCVTS
jgi:beta-lactamase superfamily II metal-dependent hydrolase